MMGWFLSGRVFVREGLCPGGFLSGWLLSGWFLSGGGFVRIPCLATGGSPRLAVSWGGRGGGRNIGGGIPQ